MHQFLSTATGRARSGLLAFVICIAAGVAAPLHAQQVSEPGEDPDARDVAMTPLTDLNLSKDPIPEVLLRAVENPYDLVGLDRCAALIAAVTELNTVLGPDLDLQTEGKRGIQTGKVAQSIVGSFIPFRGLIREASGAARHQRKFANAILAGAVRRGFLKGVGRTNGCAAPARPATPQEKEAYLAEQERLKAEEEANEDRR